MVPAGYFPSQVVHYFSGQRHGTEVLLPAEMELSAGYGTRRLSDFCTGRYCLRQCTTQLGYTGEIPIGERGMPVLPHHITASVSHGKQLFGAIAAPAATYSSIGLDIETIGRVQDGMWHLLFTGAEQHYLSKTPAADRDYAATLIFSLKEAFYKMQFPHTHTYLDFHEAEVTIAERTHITLLRDVTTDFAAGYKTEGHITTVGNDLITYCLHSNHKQ